MSLPALRALRERYPQAHIAILAKPWVGDLYGREPFCDELIPYSPGTLPQKWAAGRALAKREFDMALLLQNAFEAAAVAWAARIPERIGYARDGRSFLLTKAIPAPREVTHERFYYLELLRRAGIIDQIPQCEAIRLDGAPAAQAAGLERFRARGMGSTIVGVSPGAAYGSAKRWLPERFAAAASEVARALDAQVAVFGSASERDVCEEVTRGVTVPVHNFAGETSLGEYIELAAACRVYLTNDSGPMHIASALGLPTVAVFGATNHITTGPTGPLAVVVRENVECSPCLKRECPIDHRCMTRVEASRVAKAALELVK
jgi:heptosyltransferase-2